MPQPSLALLVLSLLLPGSLVAQQTPFELRLPTANDAIFRNAGSDFYQFVDRTFEGQTTTPWEGGKFGFVRDPRRVGGQIGYARFHEGLDIKPINRDPKGEPLDDVLAICPGRVVHVSKVPSHSNYGRYIVLEHNWGEGPFYSLYAHLNSTTVEVGDPIKSGHPLGRLGYTGAGIDKRRAHLHIELNLLWSTNYQTWYNQGFSSPNKHGNYNGQNLIGLDLAALYLARLKDPTLTPAKFIRNSDPYFEVAVPGTAEMDLAKRYPWLHDTPPPATPPPRWRVTFSAWGLPLRIRATTDSIAAPQLTGIPPNQTFPHSLNTRGLVTGSGENATLTPSGLSLIRLACGLP
jgi:murein DD-endopeptidase MepM/ murein hydrolase activator NlpD